MQYDPTTGLLLLDSGDLHFHNRYKAFEELSLSDFKVGMEIFSNAWIIVFEDAEGVRKVFKNRVEESIPEIPLTDADECPTGTIWSLRCGISNGRVLRTRESIWASAQFEKYLFDYFRKLSNGETGWGVSFNTWLEIVKGWRHHGRNTYEKVVSLVQELKENGEL